MVKVMGLEIERLGHDSFKVLKDDKIVYFDPYEISSREVADVIFISHDHFDHCSAEDVKKISNKKTVIVADVKSAEKLSGIEAKEVIKSAPGDSFEIEGLTVEVVSAYNVNKYREPGKVYHPKKEKHCGYIVGFGSAKLYHAGDTDVIEEMKDVECDIALLPVSGTYVMTAEEAFEAVKRIKPRVAIPMHYGAIVGSEEDAEKFRELSEDLCDVRII